MLLLIKRYIRLSQAGYICKKQFECVYVLLTKKLNEFAYRRYDATVEQVNHTVGKARVVFGVSYHNNSGSFFVQFGQKLHHFGAVLGV